MYCMESIAESVHFFILLPFLETRLVPFLRGFLWVGRYDYSNCLSRRVPMGIVRSQPLFGYRRGAVRNSYNYVKHVFTVLTVSVAVGLDQCAERAITYRRSR